MENLKLQDNVYCMGGMHKQRLFADVGVKRKSFDHLDRRESDWLESKLEAAGPRRSQLPFCSTPLGDKIEPSSAIGYHISTTRGRASSFHGYISDAYQQAVASAKRDHWKILVIKATSHERIPPKEKHIFQLVQGSHWGGSIENREAPCGSIYRQLGKRLLSEEWIVVLKSLVVFHRIFREGSDSFASEVSRSSSAIFNLQGFRDSSHGGWNHVPFIRCYGRYLESWCRTKANIHFPEGPVYTDIPHVDSAEDTTFENHTERLSYATKDNMKKTKFLYGPHRYRECSIEQLLEELPWLLENLECLVSCEIQGNMKRCPIALAGFSLILSDSYRLWNVVCDAMENLVESYFFLPYEQAKEALTAYGHFLKLLRQLRKFFESAKMINAQVSVPDIHRIPSNIAGEMERYLRKAFLGKNSHSTCVSRSSRRKVLDSYPGMDLAPIPIPEAQFGPTTHSSSGISKRRTSTVQHMIGSEAEGTGQLYSTNFQQTHPKQSNYYYYVDTSTPVSYIERGKAHRRSVSGSFYSNARLSTISQTQLPSSYIPPSAPSERSSSTSHRSGYGISSMRYPNRFLRRQEHPYVVGSPSESSSSRLLKSTKSLFTPKPSRSLYTSPQEEGWIYNPRKYDYDYGEDPHLRDNRGYTVSSSPQMATRHDRRAYSLPSAQ
ncbi:hypothetical protein GpartN1_g3776.t1 [Galdieria partita]|uniref:ENTH domain-containing protein n=1 Tax=Galdieria partita TaxID=83374 RepID=A0A9C7PWZ5_9RHOD|nr:hypothetical protein GpartN1_g3776.t1 [Galdieria partita]